jgi:hypothetical protein
MTPQMYGRLVEAQLAEDYGWEHQKGSGNQWHKPGDAWNDHWQIEVKTVPGLEKAKVELYTVWNKITQEARLQGREPLLVVALSRFTAWGMFPLYDLSSPPDVWFNVRGMKSFHVGPYCRETPTYVAFGEEIERFPYLWEICPLDMVEAIRDGGT